MKTKDNKKLEWAQLDFIQRKRNSLRAQNKSSNGRESNPQR